MRRWLVVGSFIGLALAVIPVIGQERTNFTLRRGAAGDLKIGMTADAVVALFGKQRVKEVDLHLEGGSTPSLEIRLGAPVAADASLIAELVPLTGSVPLAQKKVSRVSVHDSRFRTADGLGVDSTLAQIRMRHAVEIGVGEGSIFGVVKDLGMSFEFSAYYPSVDVPASARAKLVLLW